MIYDRMRRYPHEAWQVDKSGLVIERQGAWSWGDWGEHVDMGVLTNCWYYLALKSGADPSPCNSARIRMPMRSPG